jgi:predicted nucleotidyltransferase
MTFVTESLAKKFKDREAAVLQIILNSGITFDAIGIFGSYARGDYKGTSDIDFFVIGDKPDKVTKGELYSDADDLGADIAFMSEDYFRNDSSLFARNVRRDAIFLIGGDKFEK